MTSLFSQKVIDLKTKTAQERYEQLKENFPGISSSRASRRANFIKYLGITQAKPQQN